MSKGVGEAKNLVLGSSQNTEYERRLCQQMALRLLLFIKLGPLVDHGESFSAGKFLLRVHIKLIFLLGGPQFKPRSGFWLPSALGQGLHWLLPWSAASSLPLYLDLHPFQWIISPQPLFLKLYCSHRCFCSPFTLPPFLLLAKLPQCSVFPTSQGNAPWYPCDVLPKQSCPLVVSRTLHQILHSCPCFSGSL